MALQASDDGAWTPDPSDPLHVFCEVRPGADGGRVDRTVARSGTLFLWTSPEAASIRVSLDGGVEALADGADAFVSIEVATGQELRVELAAASGADDVVELHLVSAPETEVTTAGALEADAELDRWLRLRAEGRLDEARSGVVDVVERLLAIPGATSSERVASVLWRAALVAYELGDARTARSAWDRVYRHRRRVLPADHQETLTALANVGVAGIVLEDYAAARDAFLTVRDKLRQRLPADHPEVVRAGQNLAITLDRLGDLDGALTLEEEIYAILSARLSEDDPALLAVMNNLATTRREAGDLLGALELQERVQLGRSRTLNEDDNARIGSAVNLAMTRQLLGDREGAEALLLPAYESWKRLLPEGHPYLDGVRRNLAVLRYERGDWRGAYELEQEALRQLKSRLPADHPSVQTSEVSLAAVMIRLGEAERALPLLERVEAVRLRMLGEDHPDLWSTRMNRAFALTSLRRWEEAREVYEGLLPRMEARLDETAALLVKALQGLAIASLETGRTDAALALFETVVERRAILPTGHPNRLMAVGNLLSAVRRTGRSGVGPLARRLLDEQRGFVRELHARAPREAREIAAAERDRLMPLISLELARAGDAEWSSLASEVFLALESLRHVSIQSVQIARVAGEDAGAAAAREGLVDVTRELGSLVQDPPTDPALLDPWRERLVALSERRDELHRALVAVLGDAGVRLGPPRLEDVQGALQPGAALVSFHRYRRTLDVDPGTGVVPDEVDSLVGFVVRPGSGLRVVDFGSARPLEDLAISWRESLGRPVGSRGVGVAAGESDPGRSRRLGAALRERLADPLTEPLGDATVVHWVLDDFLHVLPVEALPDGDGDGVLGDRMQVLYEPSVLHLVGRRAATERTGTLVAMGGVDYDADGRDARQPGASTPALGPHRGAPDSDSRLFPPLGGTVRETEELERMYREQFDLAPIVMRDERATKQALFDAAPRARWLHLATHGWFAPESVSREGSSTRSAVPRAIAELEGAVRGLAPQTLCGLAVAGANRGADEIGRVPGIVTAEELGTIDLTSCELAVLSACETNVGLTRAGQGIESLQAALHAAGARTAITSLWQVDDEGSALLMARFYDALWREGRGKADALWSAKRAMRDAGRPTRDWAAWILTGAPD